MASKRAKPLLQALAASLTLLAAWGCDSQKEAGLPELVEKPKVESPKLRSLAETAPAYGVAMEGGLYEVSIARSAASRVHEGQAALAWQGDSPANAVDCRVERLVASASEETGETLAWLRPKGGPALAPGAFISARIVLRQGAESLTLPSKAVFILGGRSVVVLQRKAKDGKESYEAVPVGTGQDDGQVVQILWGVKERDQVVTQGGLAYLHPDFKAQSRGDD